MYEIHNYHYDPANFEPYKEWVIKKVIHFLRTNMELVGFWIGNIETPEISGASPMDLDLGSANVTWIARWDSMEARNRAREEVFGSEEWQKIWANHPDPDGYLHSETRFTNGY
jgi:hypothetical protein